MQCYNQCDVQYNQILYVQTNWGCSDLSWYCTWALTSCFAWG